MSSEVNRSGASSRPDMGVIPHGLPQGGTIQVIYAIHWSFPELKAIQDIEPVQKLFSKLNHIELLSECRHYFLKSRLQSLI
jgi:hypothetical protein